ncbi:hypothetical protein K1719_040557 [Acacia pycnantha]|nr:hypothetical protein K1719_040557 [Acacia pycnantha]
MMSSISVAARFGFRFTTSAGSLMPGECNHKGGHVGEVMLAEDPFYNGRYLRNFLHTRVMLDLRKPLAYGFWLPKPDGRKTWIAIKYEKLQTFCYKCGKIGHDNRVCHSEKLMSCFKPEEPRYGAWLSTTVCRSWDETLVALNMDEVEVQFVRRKKEEAERRKKKEEGMKSNTEAFATDDDLFCIRINNPVLVAQKRGMDEVRRVKERITKVSSEGEINMMATNSGRHVTQGSSGGACSASAGMDELGVGGKLEGVNPEVVKSNLVAGANTIAKIDVETSLALVVYDGCAMKEVLNGMNSLGLKREAVEDWESSESKRRKSEEKKSNPLADISNYANNLRKVMAKIRRSNRKKGTVMQKIIQRRGSYRIGRWRNLTNPVGSDHHILVIDCCFLEVKAPSSFRFEANWIKHEDFLEVVRIGWNEVEADAENRLTDLVGRLEACKKKLVTWSKRAFPNFKRLIEQLKRKLDRYNIGILTEQIVREAEEVTRELEEAWAHEEVYWWQRSRISWLKCGDKNTKFFHNNVIQRRQRNKVLRLKDEGGAWLEDKGEINEAFNVFYQKLFSSVGSRQTEQAVSYVDLVVTEAENTSLMRPVTNQEIEESVFLIGANKAPGPDGYSDVFYQAAWKEIGNECRG